MRKTKLAFITGLLTMLIQTQAFADAPPATCYAIPHGEDGMGSTNSLHLPHMQTRNDWNAQVFVTNTSNKFVNVKLNFNNFDGSTYTPTNTELEGEFSNGNSPLSLETGGAVLKPGRTARVIIRDNNKYDALIGKITWQADACIDRALLVSVRSQYYYGSSLASTLIPLNNGFPF